ncbi:hypothetical protein GCM10007913_11810 [Devosia yakushimensis]|uniref:Uncharacterized protein n=1 Tax=Devosia yakushimensis TaxID=470028 RepID=A0ABQ5UDK0_9HYPH|nr:DUF6682 family protein [Devosia yakushimensis]GLQ09249.1 hypothetical protein GCM10007913_11810 [Devosia yakushimensis]
MRTGAEIMRDAGILLNDEKHTRWSLPELCGWINEASRAIVLGKPSAKTHTRTLQLEAGTKQNVAAVSGLPTPIALVEVVRNVAGPAEPLVGGRTVRATSRTILDAQDPYWHVADRVPFRKEVRHIVYEEQLPLEFYVYPGNDGTGFVEAIVSHVPAALVATGADDALTSYAAEIDLAEPYSVPILDYVLFRCQSKDDTAAMPGRASVHYQAFASAIGLKIQVEGASSTNSRRSGP